MIEPPETVLILHFDSQAHQKIGCILHLLVGMEQQSHLFPRMLLYQLQQHGPTFLWTPIVNGPQFQDFVGVKLHLIDSLLIAQELASPSELLA